MMKARMLVLLSLALGTASVALAQAPVQLNFSRVVDLTLPIESNMAPIPGLKPYLDNPSRVSVISSITEAQREALRAEGMTLSNDHAVNGRSMISVLSILVHNGTHIDAPRHMVEKGPSVDQMPVAQFVKEGALINLPGKGSNSVVTVKDVAESGEEIRPNTIAMINTGWTDKMWGKPGFWEQMPYLERGRRRILGEEGRGGAGDRRLSGEATVARSEARSGRGLDRQSPGAAGEEPSADPVCDQPVADRQQPLHGGGRATRHQRCGRKSRARDRSGGVKPGQRARSSANGAQLRFDIA